MKYNFEDDIMDEWVKEILNIPNIVSAKKIIKRINWLYFNKILDFRLKKMKERK